jgi:hypothetical protein
LSCTERGEERRDEGTQKLSQPAEQKAEVVACGGEDGIDAIALASLEVIAVHAVVALDVADDRLDRGSAAHLAADGGGINGVRVVEWTPKVRHG